MARAVLGMLAYATAGAAAAAERECHTGYLIDVLCWDRPGHIALDGAKLATEPWTHTTHFMRDIPICRNNGFAVLHKLPTGSYDIKYKFDDKGNQLALNLVDTTKAVDDVQVTVCGRQDSVAGTLLTESLDELVAPAAEEEEEEEAAPVIGRRLLKA